MTAGGPAVAVIGGGVIGSASAAFLGRGGARDHNALMGTIDLSPLDVGRVAAGRKLLERNVI